VPVAQTVGLRVTHCQRLQQGTNSEKLRIGGDEGVRVEGTEARRAARKRSPGDRLAAVEFWTASAATAKLNGRLLYGNLAESDRLTPPPRIEPKPANTVYKAPGRARRHICWEDGDVPEAGYISCPHHASKAWGGARARRRRCGIWRINVGGPRPATTDNGGNEPGLSASPSGRGPPVPRVLGSATTMPAASRRFAAGSTGGPPRRPYRRADHSPKPPGIWFEARQLLQPPFGGSRATPTSKGACRSITDSGQKLGGQQPAAGFQPSISKLDANRKVAGH